MGMVASDTKQGGIRSTNRPVTCFFSTMNPIGWPCDVVPM